MQGLLTEPATAPARGVLMLVAGLTLIAFGLSIALFTRPRGIPGPPHPASSAAFRPPTAVVAPAASPSPLRYTVQRGDSPWRIAVALTGDGRRWRELWADPAPMLQPGMVLELSPPGGAWRLSH
jgi:hypothetical protein